jgi:hypothetical protein
LSFKQLAEWSGGAIGLDQLLKPTRGWEGLELVERLVVENVEITSCEFAG